MRASRLLRLLNLSIAVLLIALLAAAYWYAWRPLPQTSGQISAPISAEARIARDAQGVPHIQAASWEDAIFLRAMRWRRIVCGRWMVCAGVRRGNWRRWSGGRGRIGSGSAPHEPAPHRGEPRSERCPRRERCWRRSRAASIISSRRIATGCRWSSRCCATIRVPGRCAIACWPVWKCTAR